MNKIFITLSIITGLLLLPTPFIIAGEKDDNEKLIEERTPKLPIESVIRKAKEYAKNQGKNINDYFISYIKYDLANKEWFIHFQGNLLVPESDFFISLKDRTGEIRLGQGE